MKFKYGDIVQYKGDISTITARVLQHRHRRFWYELWLIKHSYYLVDALFINDDEAYGKIIFSEKELEFKDPPNNAKVTKLVPKNKK